MLVYGTVSVHASMLPSLSATLVAAQSYLLLKWLKRGFLCNHVIPAIDVVRPAANLVERLSE